MPDNVRTSAVRVWSATRARLRMRWPWIVAAAGVTLFAWPIHTQRVKDGVDPSWQFSLHQAFHDRTPFDDVVFTRGPLGFLNSTHLYFTDTWVLALVANLIVVFALAYAVLRLLGLRLHFVWAVVIAAPLMLLFNAVVFLSGGLLPEVCLVVVTLWACHRLSSSEPTLRLPHVIGLGAIAVTIMLVKFNVGLAALALAAYVAMATALVRGERRTAVIHLATLGAIALVGLPLLWVVVGQPISALPSWLSGTYEITSGYSEAMGIEVSPAWEYAAGLLIVGMLVVALATTKFAQPRQRWLLVGLVVLVSFVLFKDGFVRHDTHSVQLFGLFAVLPLAFLPAWTPRQALTLLVAPVIALFSIANIDVVALLAPRSRIDAIGDVMHLARSGSNRSDFVEGDRRELRGLYNLPPEILQRLRDGDVTVMPWELVIAHAYPEFKWRELPVIQTYNAYTDELDRKNADFLADRSRPRFVLNEPGLAIDGRLARFESPGAVLEMLCHYRVVDTGPRWQLLESSRDRCGEPEKIGHRSVGTGQQVRVPAATADSIVVARFDGIADGAWNALRSLLYKAPQVYLRIDGGEPIRFVPSHQHAPHVLAAPDCVAEQLEGQPSSGFRRVEVTDGAGKGTEPFGVTFYRIPFSC
jgi:hypothetical protein